MQQVTQISMDSIAGLGRGTYILLLKLSTSHKIGIGKLGSFMFPAGYYAYVGSAFGPGGLAGRLAHHFRLSENPHWHIDYLRRYAGIEHVWVNEDEIKREHLWAIQLTHFPGAQIPVPGFGCSDCTCTSHLFYFEEKPFAGINQLWQSGAFP